MRICVNQEGKRVYDELNAEDANRINQLTVIPNETYETFVVQYQKEIKDVYGSTSAGAGMSHTHKGKPQNKISFKRNTDETIDKAFRKFWNSLAKKTDYVIAFNEDELITKATEQINLITISDYEAEVSSRNIRTISEEGITDTSDGREIYKLKAKFTPLDLVEELSENTGLSYSTLFRIVNGITNLEHIIKNPPQYIHIAAGIIRNIELDEMLRGLDYHLTGEEFPFDFNDYIRDVDKNNIVETPNKGVYDKIYCDSNSTPERSFALGADIDPQIVCFLKLPKYYSIKTPIGIYEPDFGLVMKRKSLKTGDENDYYFVIETKGTNDINDKKALTESEKYKIKCAYKHFKTLGVEVQYKAPVKDYSYFKTEADKIINVLTAK